MFTIYYSYSRFIYKKEKGIEESNGMGGMNSGEIGKREGKNDIRTFWRIKSVL